MNRRGFCIFIDALIEGAAPSVLGDTNMPYVFATRIEAEREIADNVITRLREFIDGERDFADAMTVEEYIVEVEVLPDGSVCAAAAELGFMGDRLPGALPRAAL